MQLEDLLEQKKITQSEYKDYLLFGNEQGMRWLKEKKDELFALRLHGQSASNEFVFAEGGRTIIKNIEFVVYKVNNLLEGRHEP